MTLAELPEVVTVREAATFARIGLRQTREAIGRGELRAARVGRSIRIPRSAVLAWLRIPEESAR